MDVQTLTPDAAARTIARFQQQLAADRQRFIDCLPGGTGISMGDYDRALIVDAVRSGAVQHLKDLAERPLLLQGAGQLVTDLANGDDGFQIFADTLYSHIRATFDLAKRGSGT